MFCKVCLLHSREENQNMMLRLLGVLAVLCVASPILTMAMAAPSNSDASVTPAELLDEALRDARGIGGEVNRAEALIHIARVMSATGQTDHMRELFAEADKDLQTSSSHGTHLEILRLDIMKTLLEHGEIERAWQQYAMLTESNVQRKGLASMAAAYQKSGNADRARELLNESIALSTTDQDPIKLPWSRLGLAWDFVEGGHHQYVDEIIDAALNDLPQALNALPLNERISETIELDHAAIQHLYKTKFYLLTAVIFAKAGDVQRTLAMIDAYRSIPAPSEIDMPGYAHQQAGFFLHIADHLFKAGEHDYALELFEEVLSDTQYLPNALEKPSILVIIAKAFSDQGDVQRGKTMLNEAFSIVRDLPYSPDSIYRLTEIAEAFAELGDTQRAQALLEEASRIMSQQDDIFGRREYIAIAYAKIGNTPLAIQHARAIPDYRAVSRVRALTIIAEKLWKDSLPQ